MFSYRVPNDLTENRVSQILNQLRNTGVPIVDLTESNPTRVGLDYPLEMLQPLAHNSGLVYDPQPLGLLAARKAVSSELFQRGVSVNSKNIILTSSTSDAYSLLFKLLCNSGDSVLVPRPSYPLLDHLTRLDGVVSLPYNLEYYDRWSIDVENLSRTIRSNTRAVLVVNPNNPTGSYITRFELDTIARLCRDSSLALIGDEVFSSYLHQAHTKTTFSVIDQGEALTFSLGGLSKAIGLPQVKLAWIAVGGPEALVSSALTRLEFICDTYLSVATPVQQAVGSLFTVGKVVSLQISKRINENNKVLRQIATDFPGITVLQAEGGWYSVIQVSTVRSEEELVIQLLKQDHVLVHPGYFFDFPKEAFLIVSLLPETECFSEGIKQVFTTATR